MLTLSYNPPEHIGSEDMLMKCDIPLYRLFDYKAFGFVILLCTCVGLNAQAPASTFHFDYDGPDTIYVDLSCTAPLEWGHPDEPTCTVSGPGVFLLSFELWNISGGYEIGDPVPAGETVRVVYRAMDNMGTIQFFGFNLPFIDTIPPEFDPSGLPGDTSVQCLNYPDTPQVDFTDNCTPDNIELIFSETEPTRFCSPDTLLRTWTITDTFDNQTSYTQVIYISPDTSAPVIDSMPLSASADCEDWRTQYDLWLADQRDRFTARDIGCGGLVISDNGLSSDALGDTCGIIAVDFIAEDSCGNHSVAGATFEILDDIPPVLNSPARNDTFYCDEAGALNAFLAWIDNHGGAEAEDTCSAVHWSTVPANPLLNVHCDSLTSVTFIADDACGNTVSTQADFYFRDTTAPLLNPAPEDTVFYCSGGEADSLFAAWAENGGYAGVSDHCTPGDALHVRWYSGGQAVDSAQLIGIYQDSFASPCRDQVEVDGTLYDKVKAMVPLEFGYMDLCGNEQRGAAVFVLRDTTAPVWTALPSSDTLDCDSVPDAEAELEAWYGNAGGATFADACDTGYLRSERPYSEILADFRSSRDSSCGRTGSVSVTFFAADACGNASGRYQARFTLIDTMAPAWISEPQSLTIYCDLPLDSSLTNWLNSGGMAGWMDGCDTAVLDSFTWITSLGTSGGGMPGSGPYPELPDSLCGATIEADFYISDACGNASNRQASLTIADTTAPLITGLSDSMVVSCDSVPGTGDVLITDNCSPVMSTNVIDSSTQVTDVFDCGHYQYEIFRTYTAEDACGNSRTKTFFIRVIDETPPEVIPPPDTTIACHRLDSLDGTLNYFDNCGPTDSLYHEDIPSGNECDQTVMRIFSVVDVCGNVGKDTQMITLVDDEPPVFTDEPENREVQCGALDSIRTAFRAWLDTAGNANFYDRCNTAEWFAALPGSYQLGDTSTWPGTYPSWPDSLACPPGDSSGVDVHFVFYDFCGNAVERSGTFRVIDTVAPSISFPDTPGFKFAGDTSCLVPWIVDHPNVFDACSIDPVNNDLRDSTAVTSTMPGDGETVVNGEILQFDIPGSAGSFPSAAGMLEIELFKVDGEGRYEHYLVLGEDGTLLGQTDSLDIQCGTGSTYFPLSRDQLYDWYRDDGTIDIQLEPLTIDSLDARYFINDICPGGEIRGRLEFMTTAPSALELWYSVDGGDFVSLDPGGSPTDTVSLVVGTHRITYRLDDCAGNRSEIVRDITILDTIAPSVTCPADTVIDLPGDTCQIPVELRIPETFTDNCSAVPFELTAPVQPENRWLTFSLDPNTNDFIADQKTISFQPVQANALGPVQLEFSIAGDVDEEDAYFIVIGENNDTLGTTAIGQGHVDSGSCNNPLSARFILPGEKYNDWAADGMLRITLRPNRSFTPAPGGFDDGINPCDRAAVDSDGSIDSISRVQAILSGQSWELTYEVSGATTVGETGISSPGYLPEEVLKAGENIISWKAVDASGNGTSCNYTIALRDTIAPIAHCKDIVLRMPPSGDEPVLLHPSRIDNGSFDNCSIERRTVRPDTFRCSQVGQVFPVTLTVEDGFGNKDSCSAQVRVERMILEPSYFLDICNPDTLYLLSGLPDSINSDVLTFEWTGPNGFQSQLENPVIPNVNEDFSGTYTLEATGLNGCYSGGSVEIVIEMLQTPRIETETPLVCEGENIQLSTLGYAGNVSYKWYRGTPPNGVLIGTTVAPTLNVTPSPPEGTYNYYVIIQTPECNSNPSNLVEVEVINSPEAMIEPPIQVLCEGESLSFFSPSNPLFSFDWSGPNGFTSTLRNPVVTDSVTESFEGEYSLVVSVGSCISQVEFAEVVVHPRPAKPVLQVPQVVCAGEPLTLRVTNINDGDTYRWHHPDGTVLTGQTPVFTIQDVSLEEAGAWLVEVVEAGCASPLSDTAFVGVEDISYFDAMNDGPVCAGDSVHIYSDDIDGAVYEWNGPGGFIEDTSGFLIPAEEGMYRVSVTTENGCTANATTQVEVKPRPEITGIQNQGIICSDGALDVCFTISVFPPDEGDYQYEWTGPNGFFSAQAEPCIEDADDSDNGVYTLTVIQDGCRSEQVSTVLNVVDVSNRPTISGGTEYCAGDSIILETDPFGGFNVDYIWITPTGQQVTDEPRLVIPAAEVGDGGTYELYIRVEDCETERSDPLQITVNDIPATPDIEGTTSVCAGDTLQLQVSLPQPGVSYVWTGPDGTSYTGTLWNRFPASDSMEGEYFVEAERGICRSNASEPIFVDMQAIPAVPDIASFPEAICRDAPAGDPLCIDPATATSGASYEWIHVETGTLVQTSSGLCTPPGNLENIPHGIQNFYVRAERNGCRSEFSVPVSIRIDSIPDVGADAGADGIFCPGESMRLGAENPEPATGEWSTTNPGILILDPMNPKSEVVDVPTGFSAFIWTLSNGRCRKFTHDTVRYYLPGALEALDDQYAGAAGAAISFQPLTNDEISTDSTNIHLLNNPENGVVTDGPVPWTYRPFSGFIGRDSVRYEICSSECPELCDTATVFFTVGDDADCTVPTIFTPNGDGINDYFVIPCLVRSEYGENTLVIFNQWGEEIYRASPYRNNWEGRYDGNPLPPGTYFYSLTIDGKQMQRSGFIILER